MRLSLTSIILPDDNDIFNDIERLILFDELS